MLSVVELVQLTGAVYLKNFGLYFGYAAWILIPQAVIFFLGAVGGQDDVKLAGAIALQVLIVGLSVWITIVLTLLTAHIVRRQKFTLDELSKRSVPLITSVFWVGIMAALIKIIGLLLLIIPGIIFAVWYAWAETEVILNNQRGLAALVASRDLTRGRFWPIFWRLLGGGIVLVAIYLSVSAGLTGLVEYLTTGQVTFWTEQQSLTALATQSLIDAAAFPLLVIFITLLYLDLQVEKTKHPAV